MSIPVFFMLRQCPLLQFQSTHRLHFLDKNSWHGLFSITDFPAYTLAWSVGLCSAVWLVGDCTLCQVPLYRVVRVGFFVITKKYLCRQTIFEKESYFAGPVLTAENSCSVQKNSPTLVKLQVKLTVRYAKVFSIWEHSPEHSISGCALDPAGGSGLIWKASTYAASFWFWIRLWSREINRI